MSAGTETDAATLHGMYLKMLISWAQNPECTAAQGAVIGKFLKENDITCTRDNKQLQKLASLVDSLPFSAADDQGPTH